MIDIRKRISDFLAKDLWAADTSSINSVKAIAIKTLRLLNVCFHEITEGELTLHAMSLVYTTLLSIVPLLAISFSVLKAFGVHNDVVEPFLLKFLAPMGERGQEITSRIIGFVENMKVGVLGSLGLAMLIYTITSVIQKIEKSFNFIWRIKKTRSLARRFSDYVSVILIGPVLIFSAMGLTASFRSNAIVMKVLSIEPFGSAFYYGAKLIPYLIVCAAFTFLYIFLPNKHVNFRSALTGGVIAGVLWEIAGWAFASFVVSSTKYAAIYSGFAILLMFMIWLYVSWLILLVGAQVSFYHQYPHFLNTKKELFNISHKIREKLTLTIMYLIAHSHYYNKSPWTLDSLVNYMKVPVDPVDEVIDLLEKAGLIVETGGDPPEYLPKKDIETISVQEIIGVIRSADKDINAIKNGIISVPRVDETMNEIDNALTGTLMGKSLKDLVVSK